MFCIFLSEINWGFSALYFKIRDRNVHFRSNFSFSANPFSSSLMIYLPISRICPASAYIMLYHISRLISRFLGLGANMSQCHPTPAMGMMGLSDCPTTMGDYHTVCESCKGLTSHTLVLASAPAEFADTLYTARLSCFPFYNWIHSPCRPSHSTVILSTSLNGDHAVVRRAAAAHRTTLNS